MFLFVDNMHLKNKKKKKERANPVCKFNPVMLVKELPQSTEKLSIMNGK